MKDWLYYLGFSFAVGSILFIFFGIPLIAYLGYTRKLKFLPRLEDLLEKYPNALKDLDERPPYNKLNYGNAMAVLYFELMVSDWLINIFGLFKRKKKGD